MGAGVVEYLSVAKSPVFETVVGIEFDALSADFIFLTDFRHKLIDCFPIAKQMPPLPPSIPVWRQHQQPLDPGYSLAVRPSRLWLVSEDQQFLVQLQSDRLILNWRRIDASNDEYPGFDAMRKKFLALLGTFVEFVGSALGEQVRPLVVEWAYVNGIPAGSGRLNPWQRPKIELPGEPEVSRFQHVRVVQSEKLANVTGELTITADPNPMERGGEDHVAISMQCHVTQGDTKLDISELVDEAHYYAKKTFQQIEAEQAREEGEAR